MRSIRIATHREAHSNSIASPNCALLFSIRISEEQIPQKSIHPEDEEHGQYPPCHLGSSLPTTNHLRGTLGNSWLRAAREGLQRRWGLALESHLGSPLVLELA